MIYIGSDYKGFEKKKYLITFLKKAGYEVKDLGAYEYRQGDDFNDPAIAVAKSVVNEKGSAGILLCGSAHGVTIQANRFIGIRAAHCASTGSAKLAREHDAANVLCLSADFLSKKEMEKITTTFLKTEFQLVERRVRRIKRLDERNIYA